jgi:hypothetical protein
MNALAVVVALLMTPAVEKQQSVDIWTQLVPAYQTAARVLAPYREVWNRYKPPSQLRGPTIRFGVPFPRTR